MSTNTIFLLVGTLLIGVLAGYLLTKHYKITAKLTTPLVQSYLRHLVVTSVAIIMATSAAHHINVLAFTRNEWLESANALWLAVLPSLRHLIERKVPLVAPLIESVLPQNLSQNVVVLPLPVPPPPTWAVVNPLPAPEVPIT